VPVIQIGQAIAAAIGQRAEQLAIAEIVIETRAIEIGQGRGLLIGWRARHS
jgi:hypothetical protein